MLPLSSLISITIWLYVSKALSSSAAQRAIHTIYHFTQSVMALHFSREKEREKDSCREIFTWILFWICNSHQHTVNPSSDSQTLYRLYSQMYIFYIKEKKTPTKMITLHLKTKPLLNIVFKGHLILNGIFTLQLWKLGKTNFLSKITPTFLKCSSTTFQLALPLNSYC